jgi:hypothetical protein
VVDDESVQPPKRFDCKLDKIAGHLQMYSGLVRRNKSKASSLHL